METLLNAEQRRIRTLIVKLLGSIKAYRQTHSELTIQDVERALELVAKVVRDIGMEDWNVESKRPEDERQLKLLD